MLRDLRYSFRALRSSRGFAAVAIATIALAVGANTAMFGFVDAVLLRPLPYPNADRIVRVLERLPGGGPNAISSLNYIDWSAQNSVFDLLAAEAAWSATLTGGGEPLLIRGARVSARYFDIFGTRTALGRTFADGDDQPGRDRVVLLSHRLWESRFGSDPRILERPLALNGETYAVVGVLEKGGPFDRAAAQIWAPLAFEPANMTRDYRWLGATARLKPGVSLAAARAEMDVIGRRLADEYPASNRGWGVAVDRLADVVIPRGLRAAVAVLFAATLFVLLVGCANLSNLALARAVSRQPEVAVRAALGASRWQLARQLLVENLVLALCGGVAGVAVSYALLLWIERLIPPYSLPPAVDIRIDARAVMFTFVIAVAAGVLFGAAPAARATRFSVSGALKLASLGTTAASPHRRLRAGLIVSEVALAFVLLVASGLLVRSAFKLLDIDPGFTAANVLTGSLPIARAQQANPETLNGYLRSVRAAVDAVPGVRETAMASALPLQGWGFGVPYSIAGRAPADQSSRRPAFFKVVTPSYFSALGISLRAGRLLSDADTAGAPPVAVINETLANHEFAGESPIGQRILVPEIVPGRNGYGADIAWEIVGVIAGEKITGLGDEVSAGIYVSNEQSPSSVVNLIVRTAVPPEGLARTIGAAVRNVNRDQALGDVRTLDQIVDQSILATRVVATLLAAFASLALLLAAVGIYGVISYTAAQRTHELGIRAALGAGAARLRRLIVGEGMRLTAVGIAAGLAAMVPTTDVLSSMLYGVAPYDPLTVVIVGAVLAGAAGLACYLPARRIANVDPMQALGQR